MTYVVSSQQYEEFMQVPTLARLTVEGEGSDRHAVLLIKTKSLHLKYLYLKKSFGLLVARMPTKNRLLYGVEIKDDPENPFLIWSIADSDEEIEALELISVSGYCTVNAYNEAAVNTFWAPVFLDIIQNLLPALTSNIETSSLDPSAIEEWGNLFFESYHKKSLSTDEFVMMFPRFDFEWKKVLLVYLPNRVPLKASELEITRNEGSQQEELSLWFLDFLVPEGVVKNPTVGEGKNKRELIDLLFSYEEGCFLIESKTLDIFGRSEIPSRARLTRNTLKNLRKAVKQLKGANKNIIQGAEVKDHAGNIVEMPRDKKNHLIVLVSDLDLISESSGWGKEFLKEIYKETRSMIHILDTEELFCLSQAAGMLKNNNGQLDLLKYFDYMLMQRIERAMQLDTPTFRFKLKINVSEAK